MMVRSLLLSLIFANFSAASVSAFQDFYPQGSSRRHVFSESAAKTEFRSSRKDAEPSKGFFMSRDKREESGNESPIDLVFQAVQKNLSVRALPPFRIDNTELLLYDVILLLNLSLSASFMVVHRMSWEYMLSALSEGSLMSILWIGCGMRHGAFLFSAIDGHKSQEDGGPPAAGLLGFHTFIDATCLRVAFALLVATFDHRQVGMAPGEDLLTTDISFGLILMSSWRLFHSVFSVRL